MGNKKLGGFYHQGIFLMYNDCCLSLQLWPLKKLDIIIIFACPYFLFLFKHIYLQLHNNRKCKIILNPFAD